MQRYTSTKLRSLNAVIFFLFWLIVLYAGADHPPPPGFVALVLLDLAAALVYWRVPVYWTWSATRGSRALPRVVRDGLLAGLLFAAVVMAGSWLLGGGEPTVSQSAQAVAIWFAVVGSIGVVNAVGVYLVNWAVVRVK